MDRRAFLAVATSFGFGGCIGGRDSSGMQLRTPGASTPSPTRESPTRSPTPRSPTPRAPDIVDDTLEDFEDFSRWETLWGTASTDEERYHTGTQSVRIEISPDEKRGAITRRFEQPVDLTGYHFAMAVRADSFALPRLQVFDEDGDRVDFRCQVYSDIPLQPYDLGIHRTVGSPDLSAVSELRIQEYTGGGKRVTLWCDDIRLGPRPDKGKVLVNFDDGSNTNYTGAYPILDEHGYLGTVFINQNKIERQPGKLTLDQLGELQDAGWLVANHCLDHPHLSDLSRDEQREQIVGGREWLLDHGFERGASYFAFPYGDYDATALEIVADNHALSFAGGFPGYGKVVNPYLIGRNGDLEPPAAKEAVDIAVEWRGITELFFHWLNDSSTPTLSQFESIIEYVHEREASGDIDVITPADIEQELLSPIG